MRKAKNCAFHKRPVSPVESKKSGPTPNPTHQRIDIFQDFSKGTPYEKMNQQWMSQMPLPCTCGAVSYSGEKRL